jgi:hypothetical protein
VTKAQKEALLRQLRRDAQRIATHFGLRYSSIGAERANVKARYGHCTSDGEIRVRLFHTKTKEPLRYSSLIDTLCHELAHLRHFNHGPEFKRLYLRILGWARQQGIYRPRRRGVNGAFITPQQRALSVPKRNGVPVFATGATAAAHSPPDYRPLLPWEEEQAEDPQPNEQPLQLSLF